MATKSRFLKDITRDRYLYLLLVPGIAILFIFRYIPMYGTLIAFKEYNMFKGFGASPWVGWKHFYSLYNNPNFLRIVANTFIISGYRVLFGFPAPLLLALLLNEIKNLKFKRVTQTVTYLPYFISWVIFAGLIRAFLDPTDGVINQLIVWFGAKPINFLVRRDLFRGMLIVTDVYKTIGWGTIIYMAAFSGIDPALYEAAVIDGANRFQKMWYITLPSIRGVIIILFILNIGTILNYGFEQIFLLYNPTVYKVADIIDTYVYRKGIVQTNYSLGAAAGLFKAMIALTLIVSADRIAKFFGEEGVW